MKKIILIQPIMGTWDAILSKPSAPAGLLSISTLIHEMYDVHIIDQRINKNWKKELNKALKNDVLCVALRIKTGASIKYGIQISKWVKSNYNIPIIWGGPHPTFYPKLSLKNDFVDFVIRGEGEVSFKDLVIALDNKSTFNNIPGLSYKKNGEMIHNPVGRFLDLNKIPDLPYHLVDMQNYLTKYQGKPSILMETTRGCPNNCAFCTNTLFYGRVWRPLKANIVIDRVKYLVDTFKIKHIYFVDDNLWLDFRRAKDIFEGFIKEELNITWHTPCYIEDIFKMDDEYLKMLKKSGCVRLQIGIQSGSLKLRRMFHNKLTDEQIIDQNLRLKKVGIAPFYYFMIGFPGETVDDRKKTINFALRLLKDNEKASTSPFFCFEPWLDTPLFMLGKEYGLKEPEDITYYIDAEYTKSKVPWFSEKEKKALQALYFVSLLYDSKTWWYTDSILLKSLVKIYAPIAKFRMKNLFFKFMIEPKLANFITQILFKTRIV